MHVYIHRTSSIPPFFFHPAVSSSIFHKNEATVRHAKLASTRQSYAFALMKGDGSVVSSSAMARWVKEVGKETATYKGATKKKGIFHRLGLTRLFVFYMMFYLGVLVSKCGLTWLN